MGLRTPAYGSILSRHLRQDGPRLDDDNGKADIVVRDLLLKRTLLVSVNRFGEPSDGRSRLPDNSSDGRYVAFASRGTALVPADTNHQFDVFIRRVTG
jgi:hypothetical protein